MMYKKKLLSVFMTLASLSAASMASQANNNLIVPQAKGDVSQLSGATRLKEERSQALKAAINNRHVKNIILIIGDGTSDSEITSARNYIKGASGYFLGIDALPFTGSYTTYALNKDKSIEYVTDSAASASAWATGVKTYNGALGVDIYDKPQISILALAKKAGYATGNVTTAELQDATPAALVSHVPKRKCYSPSSTTKLCPNEALENGGLGSISEQLLDARADVTLGGGMKSFQEKATAGKFQGKTLLEQAKIENYQVVIDKSELDKVVKSNQKQPLLGLFASGNLAVRWIGPEATHGGNKKPAERCQPNPEYKASTPSLKEMTDKAINLLKRNPKGFFLQVESASIDKRNHEADACGQIGETLALDEAVQSALAFAKTNPDTLIILTGDHAHTSQIIPLDSPSPGKTAKLLTEDNALMVLNYATSDQGSQEHTGSQVRVAAHGPRAANIVGLTDQTDLFFIMKNALDIK